MELWWWLVAHQGPEPRAVVVAGWQLARGSKLVLPAWVGTCRLPGQGGLLVFQHF